MESIMHEGLHVTRTQLLTFWRQMRSGQTLCRKPGLLSPSSTRISCSHFGSPH